MLRVDYAIFGYRKIHIDEKLISSASTLLLNNQISALVCKDEILAKEHDISKIQSIFKGRIEFSLSEPRGLLGALRRVNHKFTVCLALIISTLLLILSSQVIWDIRVVENERIAESEIVYRLSECGFSIGDFWSEIDLSKVENSFMSVHHDVGWININRRGGVAYVSLIEKEPQSEIESTLVSYSNIVAKRDSVIEEITVKKGNSAVNTGDTVKKGDLLIWGALAGAKEGEFCRAEGQVIGRVSDTICVEVDRSYVKKQLVAKRLCKVQINIFKISINIFEMYGNLTNRYGIIENEKEYSLPGDKKLPFSISLTYIPLYEEKTLEYNDEELVAIASDRLKVETALIISSGDLIKISTRGEFTEGGYIMSSDIVYLADIGSEKTFEITE